MKRQPAIAIVKIGAVITIAGMATICVGCGPEKSTTQSPATPAKHEHIAPHGGTPVVMGKEEYHVELVLDGQAGTMQAYVLDGEMENYVRVAPDSFEVAAKTPGGDHILIFKAVPNHATGETVGNTSQFTAEAGWLKSVNNFDGVLKSLSIKGNLYTNVAFNFPKGNDTD